MEASGTSPKSKHHWQPNKRQVIFLAVAVMALVLACWWWVSRPRTYRFVGRYPLYHDGNDDLLMGTGLQCCRDGFALRDGKQVFTLRDWRTGAVRWRVTTPKPVLAGWPASFGVPTGLYCGISPDGHTFAAILADGPHTRVRTWRDGKPAGNVLLPVPQQGTNPLMSSPTIMTLDDGRCIVQCIVWQGKEGQTKFNFFIDGDRILAEDRRANTLEFAPDGQTASTRQEMMEVTLRGGAVHFKRRITVPEGIWQLGADGTCIDLTGRIIYISGNSTRLEDADWETFYRTHNGRFVSMMQPEGFSIVELKTGESWEINNRTLVPDYRNCIAESGQYALGRQSAQLLPVRQMIENLAKRIHLPDILPHPNEYIGLYDRKGHLRAHIKQPNEAITWGPSNDGRSIIFYTEKACLLYRW